MNLKIKLRDSKYCDGCPFLFDDYNLILGKQEIFCKKYWQKLETTKDTSPIRLKKCIKENGR